MRKVAIVAPVLSHFEVPLYRIAAGLPGLDVHVHHTDPSEDAFFDKDYGTVIDWGESLRGGYPNTLHATMAAARQAVLASRPDAIMMSGYAWNGAPQLLAAARLRRIPVLHRGLLTPYLNIREKAWHTRLWRKVQPLLLQRFQAHHYGGDYSKRVLDAAGIPESRQYFVPYSIDTPYFLKRADDPAEAARAAELRRSLGWLPDDPVLLYICQHTAFKAPDTMLEVFCEARRALPSLRLLMAGSGSMTEGLKAWASANLPPDRIHFPGFVSSKQTMPFYLAADMAAFPSHYDTWSRGINEAMLARRPCITSRIVPAAGGLVVHGENGYVIDGLDVGEYAGAIVAFLRKPAAERMAMGAAARTRAEYFSYETHAETFRRSLTDMMTKAG